MLEIMADLNPSLQDWMRSNQLPFADSRSRQEDIRQIFRRLHVSGSFNL